MDCTLVFVSIDYAESMHPPAGDSKL